MRWTRFGAAVLAAALAAPLAIAGGTFFEAWSKLVPPDSSPQPKAVGVCYVRETSEYDKFSLVVEGVSESGQLDIYVGDGHDGATKVGEMVGGKTRREFVKSTYDEDGLPLGVESVRTLGGRRVEVRDGESKVVVRGEVPVLPAKDGGGTDGGGDKPGGTDGGDGGGDKPGDGGDGGGGTDKPDAPLVAKGVFHRTEFAGKLDSRGVVAVTKTADGSQIRFEFGGLSPETGYLLSMGAHGDMSLVDDFRTDAKGGAGFSRDSAKDPGLPLGAESVDDLAGKRVEVRDLDENVVLYAEVPSVETEKDVEPVHEKEHAEDVKTGCDATVKVDIKPEKGREEMTVVVKDVPREDKSGSKERTKRDGRRFAELLLDDGHGNLLPVARARIQGRRARIHITTRGGRELPLGVESLRDLTGRSYDVRVGGVTVVSGTLPQF